MKILFGAIITSGRGKIGGQFVKRLPNGHSFNNLMNSKNKSYLQNFKQLPVITMIFQRWSILSLELRTSWSELAAIYPVIDAFGNSKYLNGRQFFTKCNLQGWYRLLDYVDVTTFSTSVGAANFYFYDSNLAINEININAVLIGDVASFYLRVDRVSNLSITPTFKNSKVLSNINLSDTAILNIYDNIFDKYGSISIGECFNVSFQPVNDSGWLGVPQSLVIQIS